MGTRHMEGRWAVYKLYSRLIYLALRIKHIKSVLVGVLILNLGEENGKTSYKTFFMTLFMRPYPISG